MRREFHVRFCEGLGVRFPRATRLVVMCDTAEQCEEAEHAIRGILGEFGLELHPEKTRRVELTAGKAGFDFLGCHLHKRMSGRFWERYGRRRYYLQRSQSVKAMKRLRQRVCERVSPHRNGVRDQLDTYVWRHLRQLPRPPQEPQSPGGRSRAMDVYSWTNS